MDDEKKLQEFVVSFSDMHIGEREFKSDGSKNRVTDFIFDNEFVNLLDKMNERGRSAEIKRLVLNGDIFDTQLVSVFDSYEDPPLEEAAVYKFRKMFQMHREIFDKMRELVENGWIINIIIGNHDVALAWPKAQTIFRERIGGDSPDNVCFSDAIETHGFHFRHGYEVEPHNSVVPPDKRFLRGFSIRVGKRKRIWISENIMPALQGRKKFKRKYKKAIIEECTILNVPVGNFLTVIWVTALKQAGNPNKIGPHQWVGRLYSFGPIWRYACYPVFWEFALKTALRWLRGLFYVLFFEALFDINRKVSLRQLLTISFISTRRDISGDQVKFGNNILEEVRDTEGKQRFRAIVFGHTHKPGRWTSDAGTVFNTGTWGMMYDLPPKTRGLWRKIKNFFSRHPPIPTYNPKLTFFIGEFFSDDEARANIYRYNPETCNYEEYI